jgi:hypothetical protein
MTYAMVETRTINPHGVLGPHGNRAVILKERPISVRCPSDRADKRSEKLNSAYLAVLGRHHHYDGTEELIVFRFLRIVRIARGNSN